MHHVILDNPSTTGDELGGVAANATSMISDDAGVELELRSIGWQTPYISRGMGTLIDNNVRECAGEASHDVCYVLR